MRNPNEKTAKLISSTTRQSSTRGESVISSRRGTLSIPRPPQGFSRGTNEIRFAHQMRKTDELVQGRVRGTDELVEAGGGSAGEVDAPSPEVMPRIKLESFSP